MKTNSYTTDVMSSPLSSYWPQLFH